METLEARHIRVSLTEELLKNNFVGKDIREVEAPAAVIDIAKAKRNCQTMLEVIKALGVKFRAHIKTHKV
jgi:D-serine deaminase-like pyridoxal phosphate-dependent protein